MRDHFRHFLPPFLLALIMLSLAVLSLSLKAQEDELLPEDEAFAFEFTHQGNLIDAKWNIAEGYYMYREKLSFSIMDLAGNPVPVSYDYPESKTKEDLTFGNVEVYTTHANFSLAVESRASDLELTVKGQGCNEPVGVCYPPILHKFPITLAANSSTPATDIAPPIEPGEPMLNLTDNIDEAPISSIDELQDLLGIQSGEDELLAPDDAFRVTAITDKEGAYVRFEISDGYYLYQGKLKFSSQSHRLYDPILPKGRLKQDEYFGEVIVYEQNFDALIKLELNSDSETLVLDTEYQGCAEFGVCYPPQNKRFELPIAELISRASAQSTLASPSASTAEGSGTNSDLAKAIESNKEPNKLWWILLTAFVAGIGLTFTPCVLPLIPILSSVIAGQGAQITKSKGAWLATVYVLGTAVTYAAIGAVAGATGDQLQAQFQNVWAIGALSAIFFLMALSMFGLFAIQVPSFLQTRLTQSSQGIKGGSVPMVFVLGLVSALIVGACVSPVLISVLGIAIAEGSASLGALTMFLMALGMGIPLILLGMGAGHILPKAGIWMDKVKHVFGVMLLAVGIYLLSALPNVPVLYLWAALLIITAIYLGATQTLSQEASGWQKLFKGLGTLSLVWGILALIGAIYGQRDILHPLPNQFFAASTENSTAHPNAQAKHLFTRVNDINELEAQMLIAKQTGKNVMIDYYADWCVDCIKMEQTTFKQANVRQALSSRFISLQVDVTDPNDENRKALKKRFGVFGPPAVLFFDANGQQLKEKSFYGYKRADKFLAHIDTI